MTSHKVVFSDDQRASSADLGHGLVLPWLRFTLLLNFEEVGFAIRGILGLVCLYHELLGTFSLLGAGVSRR